MQSQVKIWFQNRRAKERKQNKKKEEQRQKEKSGGVMAGGPDMMHTHPLLVSYGQPPPHPQLMVGGPGQSY